MHWACVAVDDTPHQPKHWPERVVPNANLGNRLVPLLADDVVASVRRMYADDYALVERLAGFDLDELLANATNN